MTIRKDFSAKADDLGPRRVRVQCSSDAVDRMGEIVVQAGVRFASSLPVLWSHDASQPIGRAYPSRDAGGNLVAEVEFAPEGISPKADEICGLVKAGVVDTVSIGFDPTSTQPMDPSRPKGAQRYTQAEWLELSFVSVPANPDAQVTARRHQTAVSATKSIKLTAKGLCSVADLAWLLGELGWQQELAAWERDIEGDQSQVPAMLADAMMTLSNALLAMTEEEVAELLAGIDPASVSGPNGAIVTAGAAPMVQKLRALRSNPRPVVKECKTISADTAGILRQAMDHHQAASNSLAEATKSLQELLDSDNGGETDGTDPDPAPDNADSTDKSFAFRQRQRDALALAMVPV